MIIIPAAGEGRRFAEAGYRGPKHKIDLDGKPMVSRVVDNVLQLDVQSSPDFRIIVADQSLVGKTKGAIDTILKVADLYPVADDEHLVIANCDQLLDLSAYDPIRPCGNGLVFTFRSANTAHSYVTTVQGGGITGIVEKPEIPPSDRAVSGVYVFPRAYPFIQACRWIRNEFNGREQYLSAALEVMIREGYGLYAEDAPTAILGTPEDFQRFETALHVIRSMS